MTPRNLLLIALLAGIALALAGAAWGITVAGDGSEPPGASIAMTWLGLGVVVASLIGRGIVKKPR